jgi:hypothetical protein
MALDYADGIRVSAICSSGIDSQMARDSMVDSRPAEEGLRALGRHPMRASGSPGR